MFCMIWHMAPFLRWQKKGTSLFHDESSMKSPSPPHWKVIFTCIRMMCLHLHWNSNVQPCNSEILFQRTVQFLLRINLWIICIVLVMTTVSIYSRQSDINAPKTRDFHRSSKISHRQSSFRDRKQKILDKRLFSLNLYSNASSLYLFIYLLLGNLTSAHQDLMYSYCCIGCVDAQ